MNIGLISSRYAHTLLEYAVASGQQEEVYTAMKIFSELFMQTRSLRRAIQNPSIALQDKKKIIVTACGNNIPASLEKMIDLILKNKREEMIRNIVLRFIELYRERYHIQYGKLVTAVPIDPEREEQFIRRIQKIVGGKLEVDPVVDPDIIGGFVLSLGDNRWDASISGELTRIRSQLKGQQEISVMNHKNGRQYN
ncbi:MAG: ATP synthase subunit delta [Proteiniphilum acetatigenes]|uniref:ATP synthase subunit delta n=1 Tax=Proteiniphilum acetatigenes TaxID=294710 RepID=A0A101HG69_9BACT|nr:MAG: ATP synthase subunit delta [Proteiniphilum acetatigenes]KUL16432.1 MAG: ATP synthase subunit delta [Proteiniphilum sp. 51_7]